MIKTVIIYLLMVQDYQYCATQKSLKCHIIYRNCPQVIHYDYIKGKKELEQQANFCYSSFVDENVRKHYERRTK